MVGTYVPNSTGRRTVLVGTEASRGAGATLTRRWRGDLQITKNRSLVRAEEATGTRDRFVIPQHGIPELAGTYGEPLTYESLSDHCRSWLAAGDPAVGDGAAGTEAFTRDHEAGDVLDTVALQYGHPGLGWESVGVLHNEGTITWDFDAAEGVWMWSSNLLVGSKDPLPGTMDSIATAGAASTLTDSAQSWTVDAYAGAWVTIIGGTGYGQQRQVASNTATALTVTVPWTTNPDATSRYRIEGLFESGVPSATDQVKIATPGTKVFIDPVGGTIGSTQILNRMISGNLSVNNQMANKWFAENEDNPSDKIDEGARIITGQLTMEFDRRDEYEQMMNLEEVMIRFQKDGPVIDASEGTNYQARIDVARALWENHSPQNRQNNLTATFGFLAYVPASDPIVAVRTITPLADLD